MSPVRRPSRLRRRGGLAAWQALLLAASYGGVMGVVVRVLS